jgi:CubicO group peptidase (beta-lactamase class C family)
MIVPASPDAAIMCLPVKVHGVENVKVVIHGVCDAHLLGVRDAFAENFAHGEVGATVAVTVDGKLVVDLWAGHADARRTRPWRRIRHGYHVFTFGWLVGEVVRRISGRSVGTYWRQEVARSLGLDCHLGLAADQDARVAEFISIPSDEPDVEEERFKQAGPMTQNATNNPPHTVADMNTRAWRSAEIPAGNAHTTARALARVYGALACGGGIDGVRMLSPASVDRARMVQATGLDAVLGIPTRFGLGFSLPPQGAGIGSSTPAAFGCPGAGGSIGFADPDARVGFAYVMNQMHAGMPPDARAVRLIDAVYSSL